MTERVVGLIPVLNEVDTVEDVINSVLATGYVHQMLVVDDGSTDGTLKELLAIRTRFPSIDVVVRTNQRGFGTAMLFGLAEALRRHRFDRLVELDGDMSHDPAMIPLLLGVQADLVIGSRYTKGGRIINWPLSRRLISRVANSTARRMLGIRAHDVTSGFRVYSRRLLETIVREAACGGYEFLVETAWLASQRNFSVAEVPIVFLERRQGQSKLQTGAEAWKFARFVLQKSLVRSTARMLASHQ